MYLAIQLQIVSWQLIVIHTCTCYMSVNDCRCIVHVFDKWAEGIFQKFHTAYTFCFSSLQSSLLQLWVFIVCKCFTYVQYMSLLYHLMHEYNLYSSHHQITKIVFPT